MRDNFQTFLSNELKALYRKNRRLSFIVKALIAFNIFVLILNLILIAI